MTKHRLLSAARAELFELFEEVTAHDGKKVVLEHRTSPKKAVLVSADYVERLERENKSGRRSTFKLFGSGKLLVPADEVLKDVRAEQNALAEKRMLSFVPKTKKRSR